MEKDHLHPFEFQLVTTQNVKKFKVGDPYARQCNIECAILHSHKHSYKDEPSKD